MKINIHTIPDEGLELQEIKDRRWLPTVLAGEADVDFSLEEVKISCKIRKVDKTFFCMVPWKQQSIYPVRAAWRRPPCP